MKLIVALVFLLSFVVTPSISLSAPMDFAGDFIGSESELVGYRISITPKEASDAFSAEVFTTLDGKHFYLDDRAEVDPSKPTCNPMNDRGCEVCKYSERDFDTNPNLPIYETIKCINNVEPHRWQKSLELYLYPKKKEVWMRWGPGYHRELVKLKRTH